MTEKIQLDESTEEFKALKEEWHKRAKTMTLETLPEFLRELTENYRHDYGTICHAVAMSAVAAAWAVNASPTGGITGFQAGAVMWEFVRSWMYRSNKTGLKLINYDNFLYPQYESQYQKTMPISTWTALQKEACRLLEETQDGHPLVREHWLSICDGHIPFGYTIIDD